MSCWQPAVDHAERRASAGKIKDWIVHQASSSIIEILTSPSLCLTSPPPSFSRLAGYVEALASRLGMQIPDLSPKQADMWQTRVSSHSVCIIINIPLS